MPRSGSRSPKALASDLAAKRPKAAKLVTNPQLHAYVQERLSGQISRPDGSTVAGPRPPRWTGNNKPHRKDRAWVHAWSPEQIANRIKLDFPDDESMRISAIGTVVERTTQVHDAGTPTPRGRLPPQAHDQERPGPGRLRRDHDEERTGEHDVDPARATGPLAHLEPRKEMSAHAQFKVETGIPVFFADPQSPWQRGTNENTNGLLRQYFPKGTDISRWSADELDAVAHRTEHQAPQEARLEDWRRGFGSAIHGRPRAGLHGCADASRHAPAAGARVVAGLAPEGGEVDGGDRCVLGIAGVHGPLISGDRGASAARSHAAGP